MMEEKMLPVPNEGHRRRQKQRRRRFPWGSIATVILVVAVCVYAFTLFGDKESSENSQVNDTTTQGPDDVQVGLLDESSPQNTQTANDDTDWNLMLVNYENAIPENYAPKLVEVPGGEKVDELMEMLEAAKEGNLDQLPMVVSGYRTQKKQQQLYDDKVAGYRKEGNSQSEAEELAKQWVSVPGYSEHQIGLAVDINGATYDLYFWLQENSYKYGFIFRYSGDKTDITGVAEEVWHYRYVGVEYHSVFGWYGYEGVRDQTDSHGGCYPCDGRGLADDAHNGGFYLLCVLMVYRLRDPYDSGIDVDGGGNVVYRLRLRLFHSQEQGGLSETTLASDLGVGER